ncbi:MAG: alpha/beta fold hydrolase [Leptolyngbyaceae cyanobacterium]
MLQNRGAAVVTVRSGETSGKKETGAFQLNPRVRSDSQKLFGQLQSWTDWPAVIYLWGMDAGSGLDSIESSTAGLLHCLQGMVAASLSTRLWVVTSGQGKPQGSAAPTPAPLASALWGLSSAISLEHPDLWGGWVALDGTDDALAGQLLAQINGQEREDRLAIAPDRRWGARLTPWIVPSYVPQPVTIRPDKTYLITGGLGALGLATAQWLVDEGAKTLVLISRRGETENSQQVLTALRQQGTTVIVAAVDVADGEAVRQIIETIQADHPPLAGVIHAAGTLADGLLVGQSWAQFQRVMAPKVQGAWHLHQATADLPLDFFVLFSSVASLLGSPGQGNYAAANGFLDGLAQLRRSQGLPAQSINWGPWQGAGLASQHRDTVQRLQSQGIDSFTVTDGIQHLKTLITQGQTCPPQVAAVQVQWQQLLQRLPEPPPWLQALAPAEQAAPEKSRWQTLIHLSAPERLHQVQAYLHQEIVTILGRTDAIPVDRNLLDVGLDSLMVMDLLGLCKRDLGLTLYPREVFEHPTLAALSDYLAQELVRAHQTPDPSTVSEETENWQIPIWGQVRDFAPPEHKLPGPIFLLSSPRSGSTLLRVMLAGHPDLFCPPELHLLPFATLAERQAALAENYLGEGLQRAAMDLLDLDAEASDRHLSQWLDQGCDIPAIYAQLQRLSGARRLVDKSPTYGFSRSTLERAEALFDQAHYIHLVRHPHAVIDSFVSNRMDKLFQVPDQDHYRLAELERQLSTQNIRDFLTGVEGDRSHTIRYEDLVQNPQAVMAALCTFLNLPFHPALVDPYSHAEQRMTDGVTAQSLPIDDPNFHRRRAIDPSLADAWKTIQLPQPLKTESQLLAKILDYTVPPSPSIASINRWITTAPLATMAEQTLTVRGLDLCVCTWGESDSPPVLCLHGVLEQGAIWDDLAPTLVAQGYRVIAPDLRGHGKSAHLGPEGNYQLLDHLADVDALVQVLGLETVALVGHSMGAMVAATWASARPDKVTSLTLVEPVVPGADDESQTTEQLIAHLDYLATAPTHTVYAQPAEARDRLHKALPFLSEERAEALTQRIIQPVPGGVQWSWDARLQVRTRFGLSGGTFTRDRYGTILSQVAVPTTLIFGESSEFVRSEDQAFQRDLLSDSTVHHIPGGHQLPLESPQALVEILLGGV